VIRVHNTGEIIPLDKMEKIFEPFFSTKSGNLGLGLAISREIVEHHKGFIKVVSNKAEGTAFHIYLPAMKG
jgi:signal transduction histidine kinase